MLGSFKFKLVGTFLALSVLPLAAAFWGFSQVAERSVTTSADDRLAAGLTAATAAFEDERRNAERAAATPRGHQGVPDRGCPWRLPRSRCWSPRLPSLRVEMPGDATIGRVPPRRPPRRRFRCVGPGNHSATIVASVPLNDALRPQAARALGADCSRRAGDRPAERPDQRRVHRDAARRDRRHAGPGGDSDDRRAQLSAHSGPAWCPRTASSSPP